MRAGLCPTGLPEHPVLLRLIALAMLEPDAFGDPKLTPLGTLLTGMKSTLH